MSELKTAQVPIIPTGPDTAQPTIDTSLTGLSQSMADPGSMRRHVHDGAVSHERILRSLELLRGSTIRDQLAHPLQPSVLQQPNLAPFIGNGMPSTVNAGVNQLVNQIAVPVGSRTDLTTLQPHVPVAINNTTGPVIHVASGVMQSSQTPSNTNTLQERTRASESKVNSSQPDTKAERTKELQSSTHLSNKHIASLSHKDLNLTLEAALAKVVQATPPTGAAELQRPGLQPSLDPTAPPSNNRAQAPMVSHSLPLERTEPGLPSLQSGPQRSRDDQQRTTSLAPPAEEKIAVSSLQQPPKQHDQIQIQDQFTKHNHRLEQLLVVQQMLSADTSAIPATRLPLLNEPALTLHPRHESTTVAVERLRESVLDKLFTIHNQITTSSSRSDSSHVMSPTIDTFIQGRSDFLRATPVLHDVKPFLNLRHSDRSGDSQPIARSIIEKPLTWASISNSSPSGADARQQTRSIPVHPHSSINAALRALQRFTEHGKNFRLIQQMDSPLERTCLALFTGAALGVMGVGLMLRTANMAMRDILKLLRDDASERGIDHNDRELEMELDAAISDLLAEERLDPAERGVVADVSGMILAFDTQVPLEGVLVASRELGACVTDSDGRFLFSNIKLGTPYEVRIYKSHFALSPQQISGVCGYDSHHKVEVQLTQLASS